MPRTTNRKRNKIAKSAVLREQKKKALLKNSNIPCPSQQVPAAPSNNDESPAIRDEIAVDENQQVLPENLETNEDLAFNVQNLSKNVSSWAVKKYVAKFPKLQYGVLSESQCDEIMDHNLTIEKETTPTPIEGFRIVELDYVLKWAVPLQYNHSKECTSGKLFIKKEKQRSLISEITFACTMCNRTFSFNTENPHNASTVNVGAVWGTLASGGTYTHLSEQLSCMNVPTMREKTFYELEEKLGEEWKKSLFKSMCEAGAKERENALAQGNVTKDGTPWITVYIDGSWSKRSYGNDYSSLSGMIGVVGQFTGELIYLGVRNKFCSICVFAANRQAEPRPHVCYKNWNKSAPAMEADMAMEAFSNSETLHGVQYLRFIGDGDSSVFATLKNKVSYGHNIQKMECTNHALKNYGKRLYSIKKDTSINAKGRKLLTIDIIKKLQKRAKCSIYEHAKPDKKNISLLRHDLENGLNHVFGDHSQCREGICNNVGDILASKVPELKATNIYFHLSGANELLVRKAHLLIENENNNRCERLMNIVARFTAGKRLNLIQRGSYERRVCLSGLRYNRKCSWPTSPWKNVTNKSPGTYFKKFMASQNKKMSNKKKAVKRKLFPDASDNASEPVAKKTKKNNDYGPDAEEYIDDETLKIECNRVIQQLQVDKTNRQRIAQETVGQFENETYKNERSRRLTASLFGKVINKRPTTSCHTIVASCLSNNNFFNEATEYGILKEHVAIKIFNEKTGLTVRPSGLWIDSAFGFLAASPDGLINDDSIVEVKSLFSAKDLKLKNLKEVVDEFKKLKKQICLEKFGDGIRLKRTHPYYYQIQGQLNITQRKKCYFIIYVNDSVELYIEEIFRDEYLWNNVMLPKLDMFYKDCIAPELVRGNLKKGLKCQDPDYIIKAQADRENKNKCE